MKPDIPFSPAKSPFFYGWIILVTGSIGTLMSIPGQTVGVSVFTDYLIEALQLSRNTISIAYLVGTISSAFLLSAAGKAYDAYGARIIGIGVSIMLGFTLLYLSAIDHIAHGFISLFRIESPFLITIISFLAISCGFFSIRFLGQGTLTMVSRNMVMKWFEKKRGSANAVLGISISLGFSLAPRFLDAAIQSNGWRGTWRLMAVLLFFFSILAYILYRDNPQESGLIPDGTLRYRPKRNRHHETVPGKEYTLHEARSTFAFWFFNITLALSALIVTAFTFHVISVFQTAGLDRSIAVNIFLPASLIAVSTQFIGSWLSDYIRLKFFALVQLLGILVLSTGILVLSPQGGAILVIAGMGITQGMMGITMNVTWPRFYGVKHLGAISGYAMAWTVAGSAIGPYLFSVSLDIFDSYSLSAIFCMGAALFGVLGSFFVKKPQ